MKKLKSAIPESFTILHLEDMEQLRGQMKQDLRSLGVLATIVEAEDVKSAHQIMTSKKIDFIISDWNLPDGTGLEFLKQIRSQKKFSLIPFIMCTTENEVSHMLDAVSAGANEFVTKPWSLEELDEKVSFLYQKFYER